MPSRVTSFLTTTRGPRALVCSPSWRGRDSEHHRTSQPRSAVAAAEQAQPRTGFLLGCCVCGRRVPPRLQPPLFPSSAAPAASAASAAIAPVRRVHTHMHTTSMLETPRLLSSCVYDKSAGRALLVVVGGRRFVPGSLPRISPIDMRSEHGRRAAAPAGPGLSVTRAIAHSLEQESERRSFKGARSGGSSAGCVGACQVVCLSPPPAVAAAARSQRQDCAFARHVKRKALASLHIDCLLARATPLPRSRETREAKREASERSLLEVTV